MTLFWPHQLSYKHLRATLSEIYRKYSRSSESRHLSRVTQSRTYHSRADVVHHVGHTQCPVGCTGKICYNFLFCTWPPGNLCLSSSTFDSLLPPLLYTWPLLFPLLFTWPPPSSAYTGRTVLGQILGPLQHPSPLTPGLFRSVKLIYSLLGGVKQLIPCWTVQTTCPMMTCKDETFLVRVYRTHITCWGIKTPFSLLKCKDKCSLLACKKKIFLVQL